MLSSTDNLSHRPQRVIVAGVSGVGKSTMCRKIADAAALPYTEIDGLYHGADWVPRPMFLPDVESFSSGRIWVTEWQYRQARPVLAARADTLVWLDFAASVALWRVVTRTIRRSRTHEMLWNGNVEPGFRRAVFNRDGIIRWAISTRGSVRADVSEAAESNLHLQVIRLRSQRDADRWIAGPLLASLA